MRLFFLFTAILLLIAWICAFVFLHIVSALIHLLLFFAILAFVIHLIVRRKPA